jgi:uncharacterized CHY-type Zn-finger protein
MQGRIPYPPVLFLLYNGFMEKLKIKWSRRLPLNELRQLYLSQAAGMLDVELLEDVAVTLYLRCKDIIAVDMAKKGEVRCPFCYAGNMKEVFIKVGRNEYGAALDRLFCGECSNEFSLKEYKLCYKREQLNLGGAGDAFKRFVREYENPAPPEKRMLQIDRLIHEFHYSLKTNPEQPTRPVGPNLLGANLTVTLKFLDELSGLTGNNAELAENDKNWQVEKNKFDKMWLKYAE